MHHIKCGGRIFVDRVYSEKNHLELSCITCGQDWVLNKQTSALAKILINMEKRHSAQFAR